MLLKCELLIALSWPFLAKLLLTRESQDFVAQTFVDKEICR